MTSGMEDRHATDPTSKRREPLFVSNHHHLWLSRCSVLRSSSPSLSSSPLACPLRRLRFLRFLPPASLLRRLPLLPRAALVYKADALKAAAAAARNFAGRSGENPPDAARTGMKTATTATATTITRILSFTAWSCRATWTFLRNADPALCPAIAQPSR